MKNLLLLFALAVSASTAFAQSTPPPAGDSDPKNTVLVETEAYPQVLNLHEVMPRIQYPDAAKTTKIEGKVIVRILVNAEGKPTSHTVLRSPHDELTTAVTAHLDELRFSPATLDGKAVEGSVTIPFDFRLKD